MHNFCEAVDVYLDMVTVQSGVETRPLTLKAAGSLEQEDTKHMIISAVASLIIGCNSGIHLSFISYLLHHMVAWKKEKPLSLNLKDRTTEINDKNTNYLIMTYDKKNCKYLQVTKRINFPKNKDSMFCTCTSQHWNSRNDEHVLISPWNFLNRT